MPAYHDPVGFNGDAAYFDLIAHQSLKKEDRKALREVADAHRSLARTERIFGTRREHWLKRAEECRTLAETFSTETCRKQLLRLADSYEMLAGADLYTGEL